MVIKTFTMQDLVYANIKWYHIKTYRGMASRCLTKGLLQSFFCPYSSLLFLNAFFVLKNQFKSRWTMLNSTGCFLSELFSFSTIAGDLCLPPVQPIPMVTYDLPSFM